jgi:hypothetical protein
MVAHSQDVWFANTELLWPGWIPLRDVTTRLMPSTALTKYPSQRWKSDKYSHYRPSGVFYGGEHSYFGSVTYYNRPSGRLVSVFRSNILPPSSGQMRASCFSITLPSHQKIRCYKSAEVCLNIIIKLAIVQFLPSQIRPYKLFPRQGTIFLINVYFS